MNATAASTFPLRVMRGTTGTVHAARTEQKEILDFDKPVGQRGTGEYRTITVKACGWEPNTLRIVTGLGRTDAADVTCKKCQKVIT